MSQDTGNRRARNVTTKDLIVAALVMSYLLAALIVLKLHSQLIGGVMFGLAGVAVFVGFLRLTTQHKAAIGAEILKQEKAPIGRAMKVVQYALFVPGPRDRARIVDTIQIRRRLTLRGGHGSRAGVRGGSPTLPPYEVGRPGRGAITGRARQDERRKVDMKVMRQEHAQ